MTGESLYHPFVPVTFRVTCNIANGVVHFVPVRDGRGKSPTPDFGTCGRLGWITREGATIARSYPQTVVAAGDAFPGCLIRPIPRGIGETTYVTAPNTMIESTLMTQSRIVMAVASANGTR